MFWDALSTEGLVKKRIFAMFFVQNRCFGGFRKHKRKSASTNENFSHFPHFRCKIVVLGFSKKRRVGEKCHFHAVFVPKIVVLGGP